MHQHMSYCPICTHDLQYTIYKFNYFISFYLNAIVLIKMIFRGLNDILFVFETRPFDKYLQNIRGEMS